MKFNDLIRQIVETHNAFSKRTSNIINIATTIRNWFFGLYIQEYEQNGEDRAKYGDELFSLMASKLMRVSGCSIRNLYLFRQFYQCYPQFLQTVSAKFMSKFGLNINTNLLISQILSAKLGKGVVTIKKHRLDFQLSPEKLINNLSFSHFVELIKIEDSIKRIFYENETVKCCWSIRELKRQINSLYYERLGLSKDKKQLVKYERHHNLPSKTNLEHIIRDPYVFEFLGLQSQEVMFENDLRDALESK